MYLSDKHISQFLDSLDLVLNSNTFLLSLNADFADEWKATLELSEFIASGQFKAQILEQDLARNWGNYHDGAGKPNVSGDLVKPGFKLNLRELEAAAAINYLQNMLTVEASDTIFYSPYNKQVDREKAHGYVHDFLDALMLQQDWRLFKLNTDFSYARSELRGKQMAYFEGDFGVDSATLLVRQDNQAFLLLTNGID